MSNFDHEQKSREDEDLPQWYVDALKDAKKYGTGLIAIHDRREPQHIPPERYLEVAQIITWVHGKIFKEQK